MGGSCLWPRGGSQGGPRLTAAAWRFTLGPSGGRPGGGSWLRDVLGRGAAWRRRQRRGARRERGRAGGAAGGGDRAGARGEPAEARAAAAGGARAGERGGPARPGQFPEPHPAAEGSGRASGACALLGVGRWWPRRSGELPRREVRLRALGRAGGRAPAVVAGAPGSRASCRAEEARAGAQGSVEVPSITVTNPEVFHVNTYFSNFKSIPLCCAVGDS